MSTLETSAKMPIYLFKEGCTVCTHLNAAGKQTFKCHFSIPNSQGQVNEDCPAKDHYLVIGFNPERVSAAYVKATQEGNNKRVIAIVTALNNQHEDVQAQFWSLVHYKTAIAIGAVGYDAEDGDDPAAREHIDTGDGTDDPLEGQTADQQIDLDAQQDAQGDVPPTDESGAVDSNEWNEE